MRVFLASSEVVPYSKTGGLADVCGALPKALKQIGCDISVVSPRYTGMSHKPGDVVSGNAGWQIISDLAVPFAGFMFDATGTYSLAFGIILALAMLSSLSLLTLPQSQS